VIEGHRLLNKLLYAMRVHVIYIVLIVILFITGVRMGGEALYTKNAEYDSAMTVAKLKYLEKKDYKGLYSMLNMELDNYLLQHVRDRENPLHHVWPEYEDSTVDALSISATYRKENPNTVPESEVIKLLGDDAAAYLQDLNEIKEISNKYGK
jgi:hypothetical protein